MWRVCGQQNACWIICNNSKCISFSHYSSPTSKHRLSFSISDHYSSLHTMRLTNIKKALYNSANYYHELMAVLIRFIIISWKKMISSNISWITKYWMENNVDILGTSQCITMPVKEVNAFACGELRASIYSEGLFRVKTFSWCINFKQMKVGRLVQLLACSVTHF